MSDAFYNGRRTRGRNISLSYWLENIISTLLRFTHLDILYDLLQELLLIFNIRSFLAKHFVGFFVVIQYYFVLSSLCIYLRLIPIHIFRRIRDLVFKPF